MRKLKLTRTVTQEEAPWLDNDVKKDSIVYEFFGVTYGCISNTGIACTEEDDVTPFFELPESAVDEEG